ncbi:uridine diphosphate-N-acetylglucosamine-binding protein YvcK [Corynebacterium sp. 320]|uniref:gluconeogenesis factor YvcK family protein n=1 Tax=Corynebacterium TaxID=1716 RepID=UPI00125CBC5D|nr:MULTISPECIES: uridine diphosphate-N-acetylglucosamine-binding protein YvcK [Corynebacterium]KAB1503680.1 uridine diphosphate-N-acetylglucosamine-binding protein YvcK [Corynebacterium sp. 320]KAB1553219.1 uridine diphosphate-N-acetylglucosamine-binding protein YvcK [Corynebacterium sp. 321]KAB1553562.1 uridine diphosphate-N-acetylglucosamine-binding protein YvcK [Corynebacterium sp. 319]KAB3527816.1 uridine diphosphate-N-acetylglucosamine-binding protein YvcK [Corynebacterium sp. 250]KAB3540
MTDLNHPAPRIPRIASLGGGHGLFNTLRAARIVADHVSAIVTVADDGGSSGRMRREFDCLPPGDLRMALAALAQDTERGLLWQNTIQHRFGGKGALKGHAVGNFLITGLAQVMGDELAALDEIGDLFGVHGRVIPMCPIPLDLEAAVADIEEDPQEIVSVRGQVAVASTVGQVRRVRLIPDKPDASPAAVEAITNADLVTMGPGSWFSSVIPHVLVPQLVEAMNGSDAPKVLLLNLVPEIGEMSGMSMEHHLHMLHQHAHDLSMDIVIADPSSVPNARDKRQLRNAAEKLGARILFRDVREDDGRGRWTDTHKADKVATVFQEIFCAQSAGTLKELPESL